MALSESVADNEAVTEAVSTEVVTESVFQVYDFPVSSECSDL